MKDIEVDLSEEQKDQLVEMYVERMMNEASISMFNDARKTGEIKQALFDAVVNECVLIVLQSEAAKEESTNEGEE